MESKGSILIVDDNPTNLSLLTRILVREFYEVRVLGDGQPVLASVLANPPDLILLDIMLSGLDGYTVCEQLKAHPEVSEIPVIFISALDDVESKVKAFVVGGVDYISKPFKIEEVLARVETHLSVRNLQQQLQIANGQLARQLEELDQANRELQQRNMELNTFARTVAHDLRTPLNVVQGYTDLLMDNYVTFSTESVQDYLRDISLASTKMETIIQEIMLLAGVRTRKVECGPLQMREIIAEAQKRLSTVLQESQAEITIATDWPAALGYAPWIEEVWVNYLNNALKYGGTPPRMKLWAEETDSQVRFSVRDNGIGIPLVKLDHLFVPFERLGRVGATGHGLGLSIVRQIVEKLGGEVGVTSEENQGAVFWFSLPRVG
ncbi:MAG: hybrid sensor histidine kinase/response regulator [Chloroflexota bacterium]|nr:hybrid sensor histidine kinase/response regulator [Chloroflexota bacterium]